jgi:SNF2 family DNA or RNA helicase
MVQVNPPEADRSQATYLIDRHMFAVWTWSGAAEGEPPSIGDIQTIPLVTPSSGDSKFMVSDVQCALVEPAELSRTLILSPDSSVDAWLECIAGRPTNLPLAGHAIPDPSGNAMASAERSTAVYRQTDAVDKEMRRVLSANLRPYQVRGVSWLREAIGDYGGAVLADEMGLGKTLQAIGYFAGCADRGPQLVVCPAAVLGNWANEINRFAPGLRAQTWVGGALATPSEGTVVLTGYTTMRMHASELTKHSWVTVAFDEAQVLKNTRTQVSRVARKLSSEGRIALTGTPIENNLEELWALLNLVAPTAFANRTHFRRRYAKPIVEGSASASANLKRAIEPVVMMRKKHQVANTLPPKIHVERFCALTAEQERLYDRILDQAVDAGFGRGAHRRTKILATITSLKQVCNHPGLITDELQNLPERSGKFDNCIEMLRTNVANHSPTLIFTQYRRTGELLAREVKEQLDTDLPFYHGALSQRRRTEMIERFQTPDGPQLMAISLRAGGTGLNLTRATEVVHFDRWWNPAVEAQATDRAHRIGQTKAVTVTTMTTVGTIEQYIAEMHNRKAKLSGLTEISTAAELSRMRDHDLVDVLRRKSEDLTWA